MCFKAFKSQEKHLKAIRDRQSLTANAHGRAALIHSWSWLTCSANNFVIFLVFWLVARTRDGWFGKSHCPAASLKLCVVSWETKISAQIFSTGRQSHNPDVLIVK